LIFPYAEDARLLVRHGMTGATGNIYCGLHEFEDMGLVMHLLRPGDLFVDVGANIGSYTILAAAVCGAKVLSVEPIACTFENLLDNIRVNRVENLVNARKVGLGSSSGELTFSSSLDTVNRVVDEGFPGPVERVTVTTLDALVGDQMPAFVKIDVEGHEDSVVDGGRETIMKESLIGVIVEVNHPNPANRETTKALLSAGFVSCRYDPFKRSITRSEPRPGNTLYLRNVEQVLKRVRDAPRRRIVGVEL
jgi:FkbM family methyltransferase